MAPLHSRDTCCRTVPGYVHLCVRVCDVIMGGAACMPHDRMLRTCVCECVESDEVYN